MVEAVGYDLLLDSTNCLDIIEQYDVIVDGTDNVATRYLLNDASVLKKKPLVSAGALRMDGQINIYNYKSGPCYRCIYPVPPPAEFVTNCNEGGVLGVITGIVGSIQALEVIKIIVGIDPQCHGKMLMFDGLSGFKSIKLRGRNLNCPVCGDNPTITELQDYILFCGSGPDDKVQNLKVLDAKDRITVYEFQKLKESECIVLDVRQKSEIDIGYLKGSIFIELKNLKANISIVREMQSSKNLPIYALCKHGNDSQLAVQLLKEHGFNNVSDVIGGLWEWSHKIDDTFPKY
jgi:adenylyltransferase/sulfurtransferase